MLQKLIAQLWQHSMINREKNGDITIHRLIQATVRHQHKKSLVGKKLYYPPLTIEWYNMLVKCVHNEFHRKTQALEDEMRQKNLLPHLQMLLIHYKKIWPSAPEFNLTSILNDIGAVFLLIGDPRNAKSYYEHALSILEQYYGKFHPLVAETLVNLGKTYRDLGNIKKSQKLCESALPILEQYFGNDHVKVAPSLDCIGNAHRHLGNIKQAREFHERVLKIKEQYYGKNHFETASTCDHLGRDYRFFGDSKSL